MKNIIKKWLDDHRIRWKEDIYKIPEERIDLLITMLKSEPKECSCGIEYDENREQYITLCEKHRNDEGAGEYKDEKGLCKKETITKIKIDKIEKDYH